MKSRYLVGIDLGTSACKVTVLDAERGPMGTGRADYPILSPAPRWVELEPGAVLEAVGAAVPMALGSAGIDANDVRAVGFTGLVPSLIAVGEAAEPLGRCLLNFDRRATAEAERLQYEIGPSALAKVTGKASHPKFLASKILWLQSHRPETYQQATRFLQLKDFVELRLTGRACTDPLVAANSLLLDVCARAWSPELLAFCGLDASRLPTLVAPTAVVGEVTDDGAAWSGLAPGTPVVCGANDTTCAAIASRAHRPGGAFENSGTSSHLLVTTDRPEVDEAGCFDLNPGLRPETYTLSYISHATGALLGWLRDEVWGAGGEASPYSALDAAAERVPAGAEGLFILPFVEGAGSPNPDPRARGVVFGLSLRHGRPHLVRALLEGVAYRLRDGVEDLRRRRLAPAAIVAGGGAARSRLWRQIKADVAGLPVLLVGVGEAASAGAALLAGEGVGVFADALAAADRLVEVVERAEPCPETGRAYAAAYGVYRRLCADLTPSFQSLSELEEQR